MPTITDDPTTWRFHRLHPANYAYQFYADDDIAAVERMADIVRRVEERRLSPDTDFRSVWDREFKDGYALVKSGLPEGVVAMVGTVRPAAD